MNWRGFAGFYREDEFLGDFYKDFLFGEWIIDMEIEV